MTDITSNKTQIKIEIPFDKVDQLAQKLGFPFKARFVVELVYEVEFHRVYARDENHINHLVNMMPTTKYYLILIPIEEE